MALTLDDLYASPDHYLHSFDGDDAIFVPMDRAAYQRSIFLDRRISAAGTGSMRMPATMLSADIPKAASTGWIFHIAHCGSTLLARALDEPALNLVLREPLALRQSALAPEPSQLDTVTAMLSKRYRSDLPTIVKANVPVNFLLPELSRRDSTARAIFLHYGLRDYVLAILRNEAHRNWLANVTAQLTPHLGDVSNLTDAERAAVLWQAQMRLFAQAIAVMPHARSLDAEVFFARPGATLRAATEHFGVPMSGDAIDERVAGPLFNTYSKNPTVTFDNEARVARRDTLERELESELAQAQRWVEKDLSDTTAALATIASATLLD